MSQEVGTVEAVEGSLDVSLYPIGSFLRIMPYHVSTVLPVILSEEIHYILLCMVLHYSSLFAFMTYTRDTSGH